MAAILRFSASGSPPCRANLRFDQRLLARLGQRHELRAAEADIVAPAVDHDPLDPAPRARRLHVEIQTLAVAVSSGAGGAHETGRQPLVGMAASGLCLSR